MLLFNDDALRLVENNNNVGASPQKRRANQEDRHVLDLILADKTGPVYVTLWDGVASSFLNQLTTLLGSPTHDPTKPVIVSLSVALVTAVPANAWNGPCLTSMRTLQSVNTAGERAGTQVIVGGNVTSPHLISGVCKQNPPALCV